MSEVASVADVIEKAKHGDVFVDNRNRFWRVRLTAQGRELERADRDEGWLSVHTTPCVLIPGLKKSTIEALTAHRVKQEEARVAALPKKEGGNESADA